MISLNNTGLSVDNGQYSSAGQGHGKVAPQNLAGLDHMTRERQERGDHFLAREVVDLRRGRRWCILTAIAMTWLGAGVGLLLAWPGLIPAGAKWALAFVPFSTITLAGLLFNEYRLKCLRLEWFIKARLENNRCYDRLVLATVLGDKKAITKAFEAFTAIDYDPILKKDQTTLALERERLHSNFGMRIKGVFDKLMERGKNRTSNN